MTASTLISCAIVSILTLSTLQAAPQFRSLTPGAKKKSWVSNFNQMKEAERQQRVQTYGMPAAPPNRWAKRSAPVAQTLPQHPSTLPAANSYNRRNVVPAKVRYQPARQTQPVRQAQPVQQPQAQTVMFTPPKKRSRLLPWKASQVKNLPKVQTRQELLRQKVAFMPSNRSNSVPQTNPWAPYNSRAEYESAIRRSKWEPRARSADLLRQQKQQRRPRVATKMKAPSKPKRRWSLGSIFKKKKKSTSVSSSKRSSQQAPATRSNTTPRVPNSKMVTSGLPQSNDSGSPIQTTLFGN